MVAEGESEEDDGDIEVVEEDPEDIDALAQSPGAMSQFSGTTAMTAVTTRSEAAQAEFDPHLAEDLPELYGFSRKITTVLAPPNSSLETVTRTIKQLRVFGSREAERLRSAEVSFNVMYPRFVSKGNSYIRTNEVITKFLGKGYADGDFRPDAILQLANIAAMLKEYLVTERESQAMRDLQFVLDRWFPEAFVTSFGKVSRYGTSTLSVESFELALDIRTQYAISELLHGKESRDWDPEMIVTEIFFANDSDIPKNILGSNSNTPEQVDLIHERVSEIRSTFNQREQARANGDLVDLERLQEELFSWSSFLTTLVLWAGSRIEEITACIKAQGGADSIQEALHEAMASKGDQDDDEQTAIASQLGQDPALVDVTGEQPSKR